MAEDPRPDLEPHYDAEARLALLSSCSLLTQSPGHPLRKYHRQVAPGSPETEPSAAEFF